MRHDAPEYSLIAAALCGHSGPTSSDWNWDRTISIGAREEVLPALHGKLNCPPDVADCLSAIHQLNSLKNRQLLRELEEVALLLNSAGIEPVLLKGAAYLVAGIYDDPADRLLGDIDLLVPRAQSQLAYELIQRAGYESFTENPATLLAHHHPLLAKAHRLPVEIHHTMGLGICAAILNAGEVIATSTPIQFRRAKVRLPAAHHLMTHLIMHSQLHHGPYYRIWPTLRSMLDLVRINQRLAPDWSDVRERFAAQGKSAILNLHLLQTAKTLGISLPFPITGGGLRWVYRRLLWRDTRLKYIDPIYATSRMLGRRVALVLRLVQHPLGRKYILGTPFRPGFYRQLLADLTQRPRNV